MTNSNLESAAQTSPDLFAAILMHIRHGVVVTDHDGQVTLTNPAADKLLEDSPALHETFASILANKDRTETVVKVGTTAGEERHIRIVCEPLDEGGLILLDDISESVYTERAKSDFVSLTAHQLKTPVAEMKGYAENMLSGATGPLLDKQRYYLEQMKQVCDRNFHLIDNLLDISQIEAGVITLNLTPIELRLLVEDALIDFTQEIERKSLTLQRVGFEREVIVFADPIKTVEVLKNVISNAIKFTTEGSITIEIESRDDHGVIKVIDTGTGISDEQRETLFKRGGVLGSLFMSGHGAGLGLFIAKQFLAFQNGTITALPQADKGTTIEITLPKFTATTPLGKKVKPVQVRINPNERNPNE